MEMISPSSSVNVRNDILSGSWEPTAGQFFCQLTKEDTQCLNSSEFAAQHFHELCPSGHCYVDCQNLTRLYSPFPEGITFTNAVEYGTPPNVTLWLLCAAIANITEALEAGIAPQADADKFSSFFENATLSDQLWASDAATHRWTDTSSAAENTSTCADACTAVNLLESHCEPQFAGTRECIRCLCHGINGLPFADQDIVGIGVTTSYVVQSLLIILCWLALPSNALVTWRNRRRSREVDLSEAKKTLLEAISSFQAAQCYFSIPLAIAAFHTDPFTLDPLNAFGLLPVSVNGFMPEIMTLMILNYHERRHWYPLFLTWTSYVLNSVNFWAVRGYLSTINSDTVAMKRPAFESLGGISSCGGTTGLALCLQFQQESPPTFLIRKYGKAALLGVKLAPAVWAWCTFCLLLLTYFQLQKSEVGIKVKAPFMAKNPRSVLGLFQGWCHEMLRGPVLYYSASSIFFVGLAYQATLFVQFLNLGLVDLQNWTFGQIVAITVWVPPVVDYLHSQLGPQLRQMYTPRIADDSPDLRQPLTRPSTTYAPMNHGYSQAADLDEDEREQGRPSTAHTDNDQDETLADTIRPNEFQLRSRGTRDFEDSRYNQGSNCSTCGNTNIDAAFIDSAYSSHMAPSAT